jgi:hypothetical protein
VGVSLRAQGQTAQLQSLDAWQMKNIYQDPTQQTPSRTPEETPARSLDPQ